MPPTGGPTGIPGCCECVTVVTNLTVTVLGCDGLPEAGASVRVVNAGAGYDATTTTDAAGKAYFATPNVLFNYTVTATTSTYTRSASTFGDSALTIAHPECNCFTGWGTTLTMTDPWGALSLTRQTVNSTAWGVTRMVTCQGIGNADDATAYGCVNAPQTSIGVLIQYELFCIFSSTEKVLRFRTRWTSCGSAASGDVINDVPVAAIDQQGLFQNGWNSPERFHFSDIISDVSACSLDCRQPPNLTFPGMNFSAVGGSSNATITMTR